MAVILRSQIFNLKFQKRRMKTNLQNNPLGQEPIWCAPAWAEF